MPGASVHVAGRKKSSEPCILGGRFSVLQEVNCSQGTRLAHLATDDLFFSVSPGSGLRFCMSRDTAASRAEASNENVKMLPNRKW